MNIIQLKHPKLNDNAETQLVFPYSETEFKNQFAEIFPDEHYKEGIVKDGIYVDIGANIGLTALYYAPYFKKYYAIEPSSECFEALKENTKHLSNIECFNFAILPTDEDQMLLKIQEDSTPQTFFAKNDNIFGQEKVKAVKIDKFFEDNHIEHVDCLKIDTESCEYVIFPDDSFEKVAPKIDKIIGEAHYSLGGDGIPDIVPVMLKEYGFETKFVDLPAPNFYYRMYFQQKDGKQKVYTFERSTIFLATKKK